MRAKMLMSLMMIVASAGAGEPVNIETFENKTSILRASPIAQGTTRLVLSTRREGIMPYLPHAKHVLTINAPESALQQGWRCCWIEGYSFEDAKILSKKFTKSVQGNPPDIMFDAVRTEASIRQIAPSVFQASVAIVSTREEGSHLARLYVHLYRSDETDISADYGVTHTRRQASSGNRIALNFLEESALAIRFIYPPAGHVGGAINATHGPVPSQLPNRGTLQ